MQINKINDALTIKMEIKAGWKQDFLFVSDVHYDSKKCDRKLLKRLFDEALDRDAKIFVFGDWFDAMGGKYDPRTTKADIRPEYSTGTYFTDIVKDSAKFLEPYKHLIVLLADGNHETSVRLRHEIDLLDDLRFRLDSTEEKIHRGKYNGFIRFYFVRNGSNSSKTLYYTHGGGGNSPVTKGVIKTNRRQEAIYADYYISGHIHTEWSMPRTQARLNHDNNLVIEKIHHYQLGCFKNEFMSGGWSDHKEFAAANLGGRWFGFEHCSASQMRVKHISTIAD